MVIVNQDRDMSIVFDPKFDEITAIPVGFKGMHMAYNLWCRDILLGSFDNRAQALGEINRIMSCPLNVYFVSGYAEWQDDK